MSATGFSPKAGARCKREALMGPQCELDDGHDGPHRHSRGDYEAYEWTDEDVRRQVREWEAKGGGWD